MYRDDPFQGLPTRLDSFGRRVVDESKLTPSQWVQWKQAEAALLNQEKPLQPWRGIATETLPNDIKKQLKPHWQHWIVANPEFARYRGSDGDARIFVLDRKGARQVRNMSEVAIGQQYYVLRRRKPNKVNRGGCGSAGMADVPQDSIEQNFLQLRRSSSIRIENPKHRIRLQAGRPPLKCDVQYDDLYTLEVDGTYSYCEHITLRWKNLDTGTQGQSGVEAFANRVGEHWQGKIAGLQPGTIQITAINSKGDRDQVTIEIRPLCIAEILYRPGNRCFYLLTEEEYAAFKQKAEEFDTVIRQLAQAHQSRNQDQVDSAKATVDKKLKGLVDGKGGSSRLTEVVGFRGKKHCYVLGETLKKIDPDSTLKEEMADRSMFSPDGKFDFEKAKEKFQPKKPELKFDWEIIEPHAGSLNEWAEKFNTDAKAIILPDGDPKRHFDATMEAQMLRYAYGLSLEGNFEFSDNTFGIKLDGGADFAIAEGRISCKGYVPSAEGHHITFDYTVKDQTRSDFGQIKQFDLGYMRSKLEFSPYGFAGASCQASAGVFFEYVPGDKQTRGKVQLRGSTKDDQGFAGLGGEAFVGIKVGAEVLGSREWQNPENNNEWATLMTVGAEGEVAAGGAAEAKYDITYKNGKFRVEAKAALVWGYGGGGGFLFTVDGNSIVEFCTFVYHQLKNKDFNFVDLLDDEAFNYYSLLRLYVLLVGGPMGETYLMGIKAFERGVEAGRRFLIEMKNEVEDALAILENAKIHMEKAKALIDRILANPDLTLFLTPEGKGQLLRYLCYEENWGMYHNLQEQAITAILKTLQTRNEFKEVMEHLTSDGRRIKPKPISGDDDDTWELGTETLREFLHKVRELGRSYRRLRRFLDRFIHLPKLPRLHAAAIRDNGIADA